MIILGVIVVIILACFGLITVFGAPYVPTHKRQIADIFDKTGLITSDDLVVDLGSGDGVLLRAVARRGGRALGFELNPVLWAISILLSARYGDRVRVRCRNFWTARLPRETTIVYVFFDHRFIRRLRRKLDRHVARTARPIKLISYGFALPDIEPDQTVGGMFLYTIAPASTK